MCSVSKEVYCWVIYWKTPDLSKWNVREFYPALGATLKQVYHFYDQLETQRSMGTSNQKNRQII